MTSPSRSRKLIYVAQIYVRDGRRCAYCGRELLPYDEVAEKIWATTLPVNYPTLDHVIPRSKGGKWQLDNLVVACPPCNALHKADKNIGEFAVPKFHAKVVDARQCSFCNGHGVNNRDGVKVMCEPCRGAGKISIDRYAELLEIESRAHIVNRRKVKELREEVQRYRDLLDQAAGGQFAWRERVGLVASIASYRRTISQMSARIEELGGGRPRQVA